MALAKAKEIVSGNPVVVFRTYYGAKKHIQARGGIIATYWMFQSNRFEERADRFNKGHQKDMKLVKEVVEDGSEIQAALAEWTGQRTVPNVFIVGKHIGGCDSTTALHKEGKLVPLLTEAGALAKSSTA